MNVATLPPRSRSVYVEVLVPDFENVAGVSGAQDRNKGKAVAAPERFAAMMPVLPSPLCEIIPTYNGINSKGGTLMQYRSKLIEVALPLAEINDASAYDKMPGIGPRPKGIHQ